MKRGINGAAVASSYATWKTVPEAMAIKIIEQGRGGRDLADIANEFGLGTQVVEAVIRNGRGEKSQRTQRCPNGHLIKQLPCLTCLAEAEAARNRQKAAAL